MDTCCTEYARLDRRTFLTRTLQSAAGLIFGNSLVALPRWMPRITLADPHVGPRGDTLVCLFLRGGADGLNMVVPHGDEAYYTHRPTLGIARPDDTRAEAKAIDLDGFFGLHPTLAPLKPIYDGRQLLFVQATGSPDESRSHFEAMDLMERGAEGGEYSGWLARHLATLDTGNQSALRAIAIGDMLQASLTGTVSATALQSIADYHLSGRDERVGQMQAILHTLYNQNQDLLTNTANQTFAAMSVLSQLDVTGYVPAGQPYPENELGLGLKTIAQLVKADVGVEVACVDFGGWDTHFAQGSTTGIMANNLSQLADSLAAFHADLQNQMGHVTVVVMSEFGRRLQENGSLGTDHGHGNMMMVMSGGLNGRQLFSRWPGLQPEQLVGPGDLAVTTDYRDILGEIIRKRLNNPNLSDIFPAYTVQENGLFQPRGG